jgi:hypothetical protein
MSNEETRVEAWALTTARRGKLAFGLRELGGNVSGGADIIGCVDGLLLWCEVKLPGNDVEPGSDQDRRLEIARKLGAIAIVAHSVEEAVAAVQTAEGNTVALQTGNGAIGRRQKELANER